MLSGQESGLKVFIKVSTSLHGAPSGVRVPELCRKRKNRLCVKYSTADAGGKVNKNKNVERFLKEKPLFGASGALVEPNLLIKSFILLIAFFGASDIVRSGDQMLKRKLNKKSLPTPSGGKTKPKKKAYELSLRNEAYTCEGALLDTFRSFRHRRRVVWAALVRGGNVEVNPGPRTQGENISAERSTKKGKPKLSVTTLNVRGLNNENKLRHLVNQYNKAGGDKDSDKIVFLQETFLEEPGKIPYLWRGNFHLTPGLGNSSGCITLLSSHLNVVSYDNVENRAHILACQKSNENEVAYIVANVYAPNANNQSKVDFFEKMLDKIYEYEEIYNCHNVLVAGDFNLIFHPNEAKNRNYTAQEKRTARMVKQLLEEGLLTDCWTGEKNCFTWRRPNTDTFSCLDRIYYRTDKNQLVVYLLRSCCS